ncbi:hypothetical protein FZEAL_9037 [Fusarium zealandicum]|uniref:SET domain-containing protein n=1 Tax=Fusarium zealandicum TaxID=1053134 RepID=A0A8H4XG86_9HYPO|nr:hypothetical protein FZEAL_9037 [Fusarium zealandicum]
MAALVSDAKPFEAKPTFAEARPSFYEARPSHPDLIRVDRSDQPFKSAAVSLVSLPPGALLAKITEATPTPNATWTSFSTGRGKHMEFNSDIVYINHSCDPNLVVDTARMEVRVADDRHIKAGDELTWFYPSAEWEMAQSFPCECGTRRCLTAIRGSKFIEPVLLKGYFLNRHIQEHLEDKQHK